jgi:hypothetical protein
MGWGRYFLLGNLGQQLDLQDREREMRDLRDNLDSHQSRDQQQDEWIRFLETENKELKLYVTGLVRLLVRKNLVTQEEIQEMVRAVEASGSDAHP